MTEALESGSAADIGVFLHAGQDRFSHRGFRDFGGPGVVGHGLAGKAPDRTMNDPSKALAAAQWTFNALVAVRGEAPPVAFGEISSLVLARLQLGEQWTDARERNLALIRKRIEAAVKRAVEKEPY